MTTQFHPNPTAIKNSVLAVHAYASNFARRSAVYNGAGTTVKVGFKPFAGYAGQPLTKAQAVRYNVNNNLKALR